MQENVLSGTEEDLMNVRSLLMSEQLSGRHCSHHCMPVTKEGVEVPVHCSVLGM
jgi:hypothetical protein